MLETLDEALALADTLLVESIRSGISHKLGWKDKSSTLGKHKQGKDKGFKKKHDEDDHKGRKETCRGSDKKS